MAEKLINKLFTECPETKDVQIDDNLYLFTAEHMQAAQEGWIDEDESKRKDFSKAPYWLWADNGETLPVQNDEDLKEWINPKYL